MEKAEFDKRFLALVNQTNVEITAPNIAYHLDIPIEEAQEHLLSLELNGVIVQEADDKGNTTYTMPNRATPGTMPQHQLEQQAASGEGKPRQAVGVMNPADLPPAPVLSGKKHAPASGKAIHGLLLNILLPGLGSLVCGRMIGLAIMAVFLLGVASFFFMPGFTKFFGVLPIIGAWIWSIVAGVQLMNVKEKPQTA
ncbi:MAG: hypothetical protein CSA65_09715 [Proteobacteria bacterium]|nr:MAG: hypothetical protein CSA65_09715 [Pseudomonadota bacterium]